jgi:4-nitrophenyl phosphatase
MLNNIKSLILDMDGVLWRDDAPIGDLSKIFNRIRERGLKFVFATNNGSKTPEQYLEKLSALGVTVESWQVITSALGVAEMIKGKIPAGAPVFVIGGEGVKVALQEQGFEVVPVETAETAQAVVIGIDREINFAKMCEAALLVRRGIPFFATNPDKTFPTPRGEIPGAGAWISVIVTATNVEPTFAGKPFPFLMEMALERLGTKREETLVVGDRLETDIAAGQAVGCPTALVLSGVSTRAQAEAWSPRPSHIVQDLDALVK